MITDRFGNKFYIQPTAPQPDPPATDTLAKLRGEVNAAKRRYDSAMQNVQDARTALNRAVEINVTAHQNWIEARNRLADAENEAKELTQTRRFPYPKYF